MTTVQRYSRIVKAYSFKPNQRSKIQPFNKLNSSNHQIIQNASRYIFVQNIAKNLKKMSNEYEVERVLARRIKKGLVLIIFMWFLFLYNHFAVLCFFVSTTIFFFILFFHSHNMFLFSFPFSFQLQYRVKWVGYPSAENSWVPRGDMFCDELIAEFEISRVKSVVGK